MAPLFIQSNSKGTGHFCRDVPYFRGVLIFSKQPAIKNIFIENIALFLFFRIKKNIKNFGSHFSRGPYFFNAGQRGPYFKKVPYFRENTIIHLVNDCPPSVNRRAHISHFSKNKIQFGAFLQKRKLHILCKWAFLQKRKSKTKNYTNGQFLAF